MNYGLYLSAAALRVQEYRQDVIANNLANVNTPSFKLDQTIIAAREPAPRERQLPSYLWMPVLDEVGPGLRNAGTYTDFSQGPLVETGRELDLALQGEGFFTVAGESGPAYTRDGRLVRDARGYLVAVTDGRRVLDEGGQPIRLEDGHIRVDADGTVRVDGQAQARLGVVRFTQSADLRKLGSNRYAADAGAPVERARATVVDKHLEGSGVDATRALVDMLSGQRVYEAAARMMQFADAMLGRAVNDIARVV